MEFLEMPKRPTAFDSLRLDDSGLERLVRESYRRFREALKTERDRFGRNRFTEIDSKLGRAIGFLSKVFSNHDSIRVDRLFAVLALLNRKISDLAIRIDGVGNTPPPPPPGYVTSFVTLRTNWRAEFQGWLSQFRVSEDGLNISFDPWALVREAETNPAAGGDSAEKHLEFMIHLRENKFSPATAKNFCWLLGAMAYIHRLSGELEEAAGLLGAAFQIEAKLDDTTTRSFLYRDLSYLLSHLGQVEEAGICAQKAVDLSLVSPEGEGLGESLFARAVMVKWSGEPEKALTLLRGSLPHLKNASPQFEKTAILEFAWLLVAIGKPERASEKLSILDDCLDQLPLLFHAKYYLACAVTESLKGNFLKSDEYFGESEAIFERLGSPSDRAILLLQKCHHRLRAGHRLEDLTEAASTLASELRRGSAGEAALVDVARLILSGEVTLALVRKSIEVLEKPWSQRTRAL